MFAGMDVETDTGRRMKRHPFENSKFMKARSIILYSGPETEGATPVVTTVPDGTKVTVYIRTEPFEGDMEEALAAATPRENETVLNTSSGD